MSQLIKYEAACRALAECKSLDEVKSWADKAAAMQAYGRMAQDKTMEVDAAEIRIRAERRLGQMLAEQKAAGGLSKGAAVKGVGKAGSNAVVAHDRVTPTLEDAGISKDLSSRSQKLAAVSDAEFEGALAEKRERDQQERARVSARLEAVGAKEMAKRKQKPMSDAQIEAAIAAQEAAEAAHGDGDVVAEMEAQIREQEGVIAALQATDKDAELAKWRRMFDHAQRQQADAMDTTQRAKKREEWTHKQLMRCGKAVGQTDPDKIAPAVEAFVRERKGVAA